MRFEFDDNGYVCCILYGCYTGSCCEYTGLVPNQPEEYADMDDWADRAQVQAYYLDNQGNLAYDADRAASLPAEDSLAPYTDEQLEQLGIKDAIRLGVSENILLAYPIGSIYLSVNDVNPEYILGGVWEKIEDKFLLAAGSTYEGGTEGGAESHRHIAPIGYESSSQYLGTINVNGTTTTFNKAGGYNTVKRDAGGGSIPSGISAYYTQDESNMPPYLAVYVWKRIE